MNASDELLWSYLSTANGLSCWQADTVVGSLQSGNFSLRWPELGARLDLSVAEVEIGRRLVLRAGTTSLELTVENGEVTLVHRGLDSEDDLKGFESSWRTALSLFRLAVTEHPRATRQVKWFFQQVPPTAELLHCYFTEPAALATWLGKATDDLTRGNRYALELFGGQTMTGKVLHAKRDVCLQVHEWNNGALAMRSLPGPDQSRIAALGVSTWNGGAPDGVAAILQGALRRLSNTTQTLDS